jgi:pimeloyl-ACP methyl ester carboxylesterase
VTAAPIILVPGFWLGAWAWDDVAATLRDGGHDVTALTLPGLESAGVDRSRITLADHVDAICAALAEAAAPAVLAVHSGAGLPGYAASDRLPERIAAMVYVDSGPATGAIDPGVSAAEVPLPAWEDLDESLEGLTPEQLAAFRDRAIPEPGAALREAPDLGNEARLDVPSIVVCTSFPSAQIRAAVAEGHAWVGGLAELREVAYVDLPTSHWPMWSRSRELAAIIGDAARTYASDL